MDEHSQTPWWRTPFGFVLCGFLAVAGFFLLTEHTAHVFGALPYLLLAACPLMHIFMHHGHGHDHRSDGKDLHQHDHIASGGNDEPR
jgi:peptidoglycan/LPS O-acetylase OafA/YrhL